MSKQKQGVWVLKRSHNDYDQHGEYFEAVWQSQPTLEQLAKYFASATTYVSLSHNVMGAVAFLEHLRGGGGRRAPDVPQYVTVRYYTYEQKGITWRVFEKGKDELDTYLKVMKGLNRLKKRADKRRENKEQTK